MEVNKLQNTVSEISLTCKIKDIEVPTVIINSAKYVSYQHWGYKQGQRMS